MKLGSLFGLISGLLLLITSILAAVAFSSGVIPPGVDLSPSLLLSLSLVGALSGIIVLIGTYLSLKARTAKLGGMLIIIFSAIGIVSGGGFFVGSILGLIGGAFVLVKK